ncbi:hypothetical protein KAR02_14155 [Candidatus Bipolaricaulota bacterium]|nr:hypothetical protein [Candidatus Bipolaricaulota bacterium]
MTAREIAVMKYRAQRKSKSLGAMSSLSFKSVDDPYIDYIIATIYETKMAIAQSAKLAVDAY